MHQLQWSVCLVAGSLIKLDMTQMGLFCEFPYAQMQAFSTLTSISFQGNAISGDIETVGASLKGLSGQLAYLDLSYNLLNGSFAGWFPIILTSQRNHCLISTAPCTLTGLLILLCLWNRFPCGTRTAYAALDQSTLATKSVCMQGPQAQQEGAIRTAACTAAWHSRGLSS